MNTATSEWKRALSIVQEGWIVSPRRQPCIEILNHTSVVDMKKPKVVCPPRKLGKKFTFLACMCVICSTQVLTCPLRFDAYFIANMRYIYVN